MCFSIPQEKTVTIRNFPVRKKTKTVQEKRPSDIKQRKMLQDFERRVGVSESGLYFSVPVCSRAHDLGAKQKEIQLLPKS